MVKNNTTDDEQVEWQRVKASILRLDQNVREINAKMTHLIERDSSDMRLTRRIQRDEW